MRRLNLLNIPHVFRGLALIAIRAAVLVAVLAAVLGVALKAHALLPQTQKDLRVAEDRLRHEVERIKGGSQGITPILVATPQAHWAESKDDFAAAMSEVVARVFPGPGDVIPCGECVQNRVYVSGDNRMVVQNSELSITDLARLREKPGFAQAKTVLIARETPSGISMRLMTIEDGRILYTGVADATKTLEDVEPPMRLARELERRERGEALSYFHFDLGLYPQGLVQMKWLEQWGTYNQHLSGLAIGAYNPTGAIGLTYLYMLPFNRRATVGLTGYYSLAGVFESGSSGDRSSAFVAQASLNYAFSGSYGVFIAADTKSVISIGMSLQNPVFLPFLF